MQGLRSPRRRCPAVIRVSADGYGPDWLMTWDREFDPPVPGFRTLGDAANHIMKLPKAEQAKKHWQTAAEAVLMAAEDRGPMMHAHIGMLQALKHNEVRQFNPDAKEHHWGKRKLKRDL